MIDLDVAINSEDISDSDSSSRGDVETSKKMLTASQVITTTVFYLHIIITIYRHTHLIIIIINLNH